MLKQPGTYLLAGQATELERLQLQSKVWEPSARDLLNELVTNGVSEAVVDLSKAVHIKKQNGIRHERLAELLLHQLPNGIDEVVSIRESGQPIVISGVTKSRMAFPKHVRAFLKLFDLIFKFLNTTFSLLSTIPFSSLCFCRGRFEFVEVPAISDVGHY